MNKGIVIILCSIIISIGIGTHGYFVGKGVRESQPWHYLSDPIGLLRNIEIPEDLKLGFKARRMNNGDGVTFKFKVDEQAYEGSISGSDGMGTISGEIDFEKIDLSDY